MSGAVFGTCLSLRNSLLLFKIKKKDHKKFFIRYTLKKLSANLKSMLAVKRALGVA